MNIYPQLMTYGGIVCVIGLLCAFANIFFAASLKSTGIVGIMLRHILFGLMYVGGGASFVIGFILYIVKVCKS